MKNKKNNQPSSPVCYAEAKDLRPEFRNEEAIKKPTPEQAGPKPEN